MLMIHADDVSAHFLKTGHVSAASILLFGGWVIKSQPPTSTPEGIMELKVETTTLFRSHMGLYRVNLAC